MTDEEWMRQAMELARQAASEEETPIGCVIVHENKIIGKGYNKRNQRGNPLCHAELEAINEAAGVLGDWRLEECTLYVTLEPCPMCAGAIVQARIPRCVIGCMNPKAGCAGSVLNLLQNQGFNHQAEITAGVLEAECSAMMKQFFRELRQRDAERKKKRAMELAEMDRVRIMNS